MALPMTPSDLHDLADALAVLEETMLAKIPVFGRIEVFLPDGDEVVGYFERVGDPGDDAWYGYVAK